MGCAVVYRECAGHAPAVINQPALPPPPVQDSIKSSQSWFMACAAYAPGLVRLMAQRLVNLQEFDKQLHLIYLANDILFKA